jgi:DNA-binding CsgD family transcriptional regulator
MHPPIFVREPSAEERARLEAALRASDAFTVRRAQIVLLSADGRRPREIARGLRCAVQTVRNGVRAFNAAGVGALTAGSSRPKSAAPVLGAAELGRLRAVLHQPPRAFGHARSTWTLALLAEVAHGQGLSPTELLIPGQVGHRFRDEAGHRFRRDVGHPDLKSATRRVAVARSLDGSAGSCSSRTSDGWGSRCQPREYRCDAYERSCV